MMTTVLITPADATKMLLAHVIGVGEQCELYFMECDKFLTTLEESCPKCSAGDCNYPMNTHSDVGAIVMMHGMCDNPTICILSGICSPCWKQKFEEDRDKAMEGFLDYLRSILPDMKVHSPAEMSMTGNAPSTFTIN